MGETWEIFIFFFWGRVVNIMLYFINVLDITFCHKNHVVHRSLCGLFIAKNYCVCGCHKRWADTKMLW